jgi:aminopeptidase N
VHATALAILERTERGSTMQLSAFQAAAGSSTDDGRLRSWLEGRALPPGIELDLALRWRILVRLATLGETTRDELAAALASEPTAVSRVEHARATASLPDAQAKAWAWQRFSGEVDVPNYELEATGLGMWRVGQEELTASYAERYFHELPDTVDVRSGWLLADAAEAFFPITSLTDKTLSRARALIDLEGLDLSLRRQVVDRTDELARRIAIRQAFARP